jgi:hypothetical protein
MRLQKLLRISTLGKFPMWNSHSDTHYSGLSKKRQVPKQGSQVTMVFYCFHHNSVLMLRKHVYENANMLKAFDGMDHNKGCH